MRLVYLQLILRLGGIGKFWVVYGLEHPDSDVIFLSRAEKLSDRSAFSRWDKVSQASIGSQLNKGHITRSELDAL